ncbi:hypothetical protein NW765_017645 [Fusarium oxysporum]|nr:hypothetical protein NW765_017645 [Fusarium oxysporum]KAJ4242803.1 hypothetical protein NW764_016631 [Fusarium oxysporum]
MRSNGSRRSCQAARHAEACANPDGPGDARPTAIQMVKDEGANGRLVGILKPGEIELVEMNNTSLSSVRAAAKAILQKSDNRVNILVNNAGIMALPKLEYTKDRLEMQLGVNHLPYFLLFELLKPALLASASPGFSSRVVNLSSSAHHVASSSESGNYNFEKTEYNQWVAYWQSRTANIHMANEIERRYGSRGLHANSVHPGIISTPLMVHMDEVVLAAMQTDPRIPKMMKSPEQGAATTVWAAIGKEWENKGGEYLAECWKTVRGNDKHEIVGEGFAGHAYVPENEARLWEDSL